MKTNLDMANPNHNGARRSLMALIRVAIEKARSLR